MDRKQFGRRWIKGLIGQQFGKLIVAARDELVPTGIGKSRYWICKCDCGRYISVRGSHLKSKGMQSCGCLRSAPRKNLVGRRFDRLVILSYVGNTQWLCKCDCGNYSLVRGYNLARTGSCGCLNRDLARSRIKHGHSRTKRRNPTYKIWTSMRERCKHSRYHRYGGRGITVCAGWRDDYLNFLHDMGERPPGKSLDRVDNDKGYWCGRCDECLEKNQKLNCHWATAIEQARNQSTNRLLTINRRTLTAVEWAEIGGIPYQTFMSRLKRGWNAEKALI